MLKLKLIVILLFVGVIATAALVVPRLNVNAEDATAVFDTCRNISFRVSNARSRPIMIVKVKYFNADKNKWQTEDVPNVTCPVNHVCYFGSENLSGAENDRLTKIVVVFQDEGSNTDQASPQFNVDSPACRANKQYGAGQNWAISGGATSGFGFEDESTGTCKNVSFKFKNSRAHEIEIRKVKYYNRNEGRWQTEDVPNTKCRSGQTCSFGREDLRDSGGDDITRLKFVFHDDFTREDLESAEFVPSSPQCNDEKVFGYGQTWTTAGSTVISNSGGGGSDGPFNPGKAIFGAPGKIADAIENADLAGDCKRVTFNIKNNLNKRLKIRSIEYYNRSSGKWKTENMGGSSSNNGCSPGSLCNAFDGNFASEELLGIGHRNSWSTLGGALGDDITKVKFVYQTSSSESGPWSKQTTSKIFEPQSPRCTEGKNYGQAENWSIGNANTGSSGGSATLTQMDNGGTVPGGAVNGRSNPNLTSGTAVSPAVTGTPAGKGGKGKNKGKNKAKQKGTVDPPAAVEIVEQQPSKPKAKAKAKAKNKNKN